MRPTVSALLLFALVACGDTDPVEVEQAPQEKVEIAEPAVAPPVAPKPDANTPPPPTPLPADAHPALTDPSLAAEEGPANYTCRFETSKGGFAVKVTRAWAPLGADRFYNLCKIGYFNDARFFRNVRGFMVQFGVSAYPAATEVWQKATIQDDPVIQSNKPLYVTFAKTGAPNSRSTQVFINHGDNANLDGMGFAPFGQVVEGADVVAQLYDGYGEGAPRGRGPDQGVLSKFGEVYLADVFPKLDSVVKTTID